MTQDHVIVPFNDGLDLSDFDCGHDTYNTWLRQHAATAVRAGTAAVYVLMQDSGGAARAVGYHAIAPTSVVRTDLPRRVTGGAPDPVPAFLLARMALDRSHQGDPDQRWGTQLLLDALRRIVAAASISGGRVVVVDADGPGLVPFYRGHGFLPTGTDQLRLYMKVASARAALARYDQLS